MMTEHQQVQQQQQQQVRMRLQPKHQQGQQQQLGDQQFGAQQLLVQNTVIKRKYTHRRPDRCVSLLKSTFGRVRRPHVTLSRDSTLAHKESLRHLDVAAHRTCYGQSSSWQEAWARAWPSRRPRSQRRAPASVARGRWLCAPHHRMLPRRRAAASSRSLLVSPLRAPGHAPAAERAVRTRHTCRRPHARKAVARCPGAASAGRAGGDREVVEIANR
jgi:hypothetical protein